MKIKETFIKIQKVIRSGGVNGLGIIEFATLRAFPAQPRITALCKELLKEQCGLEIGGPSWFFSREGNLPIYSQAARLDNCNFGQNTIWEGSISEGNTFKYDESRPPGHQYVGEAVNLKAIPDSTYDFVLSCHSIEHTANPLGAIKEWMRVLRPDGKLLLITPHMERTFDHRRPVTKMAHLIQDFQMQTGEDDLTHLAEVLKLHDIDRDLGTTDFKAFKERCERNLQIRAIHHHVFNTRLVVSMLDYMKLKILAVEAMRPFHIIAVAQKVADNMPACNQAYISASAEWKQTSPFKSDGEDDQKHKAAV